MAFFVLGRAKVSRYDVGLRSGVFALHIFLESQFPIAVKARFFESKAVAAKCRV